MVAKKRRTTVVLDTNVFVRAFKSTSGSSPNKRDVRCWLLEKRLLPVVCEEVVTEYLEVFESVLALQEHTLREWAKRFSDSTRVQNVNLGRRFTQSRDADDNIMLAAAFAGKAAYLVTNDLDLLDLPADVTGKFPFEIVSPPALLGRLGLERTL